MLLLDILHNSFLARALALIIPIFLKIKLIRQVRPGREKLILNNPFLRTFIGK